MYILFGPGLISKKPDDSQRCRCNFLFHLVVNVLVLRLEVRISISALLLCFMVGCDENS